MARLTSKLQVSIPKALADRVGLRPGDDIHWELAGDLLRVRVGGMASARSLSVEERLRAFDAATARQVHRDRGFEPAPARTRRWRREDLYDRHDR